MPEPRILPVCAVLFDLDGTLADTAPDLAAAANRVRADQALPPMPVAALRGYASHGARGLLEAALGVTREHPDFARLRDDFLAYYEADLATRSRLFDGADRVLDAIESRGFSWGIVTNKHERYTRPLLVALGLATRTGAVVCGDTTPHAKPHPAPLLEAARRLGIAPAQCVYVGDSERDVAAGIAAGMATLIARYGYLTPADVPDEWPASGSIDAIPELLDWLPARAARARVA